MTENGSSLKVINPATEESIEEIPISSREDLERAAQRARQAFKEWRAISGLERAELFHEIANNLRGHADEIAEVMTREGGKPFIENHDEVGWTAASFDYYAEIARDSVGYLPAPIEPQQLALRSEEHTSELQSRQYLVCRLLLEKKKKLVQTNDMCSLHPLRYG